MQLALKLFDRGVHLAGDQSERHNARHVHLGAENVHVELELLTDGLDVPETFLVVGSSATHPDLNVVLDEEGGDFADGADDTLERRCDLQ